MGANGLDVQLSTVAKKVFPYGTECKNLSAIAIYKYYNQHTMPDDMEPLLVVKQNNAKPLAIVSLEHFMELVRKANGNN